MYNPANQYRCTIIRGKSQSEMDNLLPLYANIIDTVCPCKVDEFKSKFNDTFSSAFTIAPTLKTLNNHRTEIAGQLFGMYYTSDDGIVYPSERTLKFLSDSDTPAFFKDICYKMQFPNGSQKINTVKERIDSKINIRQFPFILKVMLLAKSNNEILTKKDIGYYILNSLDVLQGIANPLEVYDTIALDKKNGVERSVGSGSNANQHINEQINLLELSNLVIVTNGEVSINPHEIATVQIFASMYEQEPAFDVYSYDLDSADGRKAFYTDWDFYFSQLSDRAKDFDTSAEALGITVDIENEKTSNESDRESTIAIGDEGERFVYEYEKRRVTDFNFRLAGKVIHLGKTRGLGYDIQSVVAKNGDDADFVKYIEVKATKRVTAPDINNPNWIDTLSMTRNEWVASQQHKDSYSIFRVYLVRDSVIMFVLTDIAQKCKDNLIQAVPTNYRLDFGNTAVDEVINHEGGATENA
ncbi:MAG: DUF3883 domain-containing protein [Defluviitaleaceae bacterium]|nr:DUF3883 domain-containing protein [Defluviitaleaceae bacterium]